MNPKPPSFFLGSKEQIKHFVRGWMPTQRKGRLLLAILCLALIIGQIANAARRYHQNQVERVQIIDTIRAQFKLAFYEQCQQQPRSSCSQRLETYGFAETKLPAGRFEVLLTQSDTQDQIEAKVFRKPGSKWITKLGFLFLFSQSYTWQQWTDI
ncbi:MAG: hypothetical protein HQL72_06145 [Magnetococcales bacterium]|nr:hypothetical protein [Magnetococcales bacterium]